MACNPAGMQVINVNWIRDNSALAEFFSNTFMGVKECSSFLEIKAVA